MRINDLRLCRNVSDENGVKCELIAAFSRDHALSNETHRKHQPNELCKVVPFELVWQVGF